MQVTAGSLLMNVSPGKSQKVQKRDFRHFQAMEQHANNCILTGKV